MTVLNLSNCTDFVPLVKVEENREVTSVFCCDLLSLAMGRAPANGVWVTVMGNVNAVAVAALADLSGIVLAEGMPLNEDARIRAQEQGIAVYSTDLPVFEAAQIVHRML